MTWSARCVLLGTLGLLVGCQLYDSTSAFADLCEFYERCEEIEESEVAECIEQHEELYEGTWSEQVVCAQPEIHSALYPEGYFADLCSDDCQDASRDYLLCLGREGGACEDGLSTPEACEVERVEYVVACPGLAADEPSMCGNGLVEGDEQCDDGNSDDEDECSNDCVAHCGLRDVVLGPASDAIREAIDVAVDSHGHVIVVGSGADGAGKSVILAEKYMVDGSLDWDLGLESPLGTDTAHAVAVDGSDNIIIVGSSTVEQDGQTHAWVGKYGDAGGEVWTQDWGPGLELVDLTALPGGALLVAGTVVVDEGQHIWIRKLNGAGEEAWTVTHSHDPDDPLAKTRAGPVAIGPAGDLHVLASAEQEDGSDRVVLTSFSTTDGQFVAESWPLDHDAHQVPRALVGDGTRLYAGIEEDNTEGIWLLGIAAEGETSFSVSGPEIDALAPPRSLHGISLAADGSLSIGGTNAGRRWMGRMAPWGDVLCHSGIELDAEDPVPALVTDGGGGPDAAPLAVGFSVVDGESRLWLGHHRP